MDAQHGGRDAASARRMVPGVLRHSLVDRAASAEGLAVPEVPPAGSSADRGGPQGRGGVAAGDK